jgi:hypothetical protein
MNFCKILNNNFCILLNLCRSVISFTNICRRIIFSPKAISCLRINISLLTCRISLIVWSYNTPFRPKILGSQFSGSTAVFKPDILCNIFNYMPVNIIAILSRCSLIQLLRCSCNRSNWRKWNEEFLF